MIDFRTAPDRYRHWTLSVSAGVATLALKVDEHSPLQGDYELKLNSYDLGVDIELHDAVQRLRFEHPEVGAVVLTSANSKVFSAGANIRMLSQSTHAQKINFCKFTNETRIAIEDASENSGQRYICAINGPAAGGGYELALATDYLMMVDDGSTSVSLPEVALLGVLPGTGGLTRLTDKRQVRHDIADHFCTLEEGVRGQRAVDWRLVDEVVPSSRFSDAVAAKAQAVAQRAEARSGEDSGFPLVPVERDVSDRRIRYRTLEAILDRDGRSVDITLFGPDSDVPESMAGACRLGCQYWPLAQARDFEDLLLHLRHNEAELGLWLIRSQGDLERVLATDAFLSANATHWLGREILLYWKRNLRRLQLSARSIFTLVEPGSCFGGTLLELVLAADRSFMLDGVLEDGQLAPMLALSDANFGTYPTINGLTRLAARYLDDPDGVSRVRQSLGHSLDAATAEHLRLVTFIPDDIDWEDEVRIAVEERRGFSPDALTGMEANLRCPGPETMESRIFARLSAWQNWIFLRPNAMGEGGALARYGTGKRPAFDKART